MLEWGCFGVPPRGFHCPALFEPAKVHVTGSQNNVQKTHAYCDSPGLWVQQPVYLELFQWLKTSSNKPYRNCRLRQRMEVQPDARVRIQRITVTRKTQPGFPTIQWLVDDG